MIILMNLMNLSILQIQQCFGMILLHLDWIKFTLDECSYKEFSFEEINKYLIDDYDYDYDFDIIECSDRFQNVSDEFIKNK
jgi:hypothetical protein